MSELTRWDTDSSMDLRQEMKRLPPETSASVDHLMGQAVTYVWGWQDAGGAERDSNVAYRFGTAYGWHALRYATAQIGYRLNIKDAYARWIATGRIED